MHARTKGSAPKLHARTKPRTLAPLTPLASLAPLAPLASLTPLASLVVLARGARSWCSLYLAIRMIHNKAERRATEPA